jgi:hypothetical protein
MELCSRCRCRPSVKRWLTPAGYFHACSQHVYDVRTEVRRVWPRARETWVIRAS